ncbi:capsular biosynthesis protein [Gordoniibacillus kamchatkensis]|uniref:non-specific protein-tyrosine kinase n=1 Tax=Gordoniibacillus kamchatkensis TaxID=1590651 RepID=A0ABR5AIF3_9BACL|nr:CpsD/CapB family tyrosine-protein kinase [Paenibacillus sp. VKM B-2647]KIL40137.1 capsular biosynthesis protein [Paenibacillus sp. VKM B-2647]
MSSSRRNERWPLITNTNTKSPISEAYRILRTNIEFSNVDRNLKCIMFASSQFGEGKSTTASNLAVTYAQTNRKVLLIDCDMRRPSQHHIFMLSNRYGLSSYLSHQVDLDEIIVDSTIPNLSVIVAGPIPPNPSELLASKRMSAMLEQLREQFDMIIIDTPPIMAVADAQIAATLCDGVLLVMDSGRVKREIAMKSKQKLEHVKARILGVVLNKISRKNANSYYYYYYGDRDQGEEA